MSLRSRSAGPFQVPRPTTNVGTPAPNAVVTALSVSVVSLARTSLSPALQPGDPSVISTMTRPGPDSAARDLAARSIAARVGRLPGTVSDPALVRFASASLTDPPPTSEPRSGAQAAFVPEMNARPHPTRAEVASTSELMPSTAAAHLDWTPQPFGHERSIGSFIDADVSSTIMMLGVTGSACCGGRPQGLSPMPAVPVGAAAAPPPVPTTTDCPPAPVVTTPTPPVPTSTPAPALHPPVAMLSAKMTPPSPRSPEFITPGQQYAGQREGRSTRSGLTGRRTAPRTSARSLYWTTPSFTSIGACGLMSVLLASSV